MFPTDSDGKPPLMLIDRVCFLFAKNKGSLDVKGWGPGYNITESEAFELTHFSGVLFGFCFAHSRNEDFTWQKENVYKPLIARAKMLGYIALGYNPFPNEKADNDIKS